MNLSELWLQLTEMASSQSAIFEIQGRKISEQQFIWGVVILMAILTIILVRNIALWIVSGTAKKVAVATQPLKQSTVKINTTTSKDDHLKLETKKEKTSNNTEVGSSPEKLLENTSERRRTRYDFVTPDSVQSKVMKKTLNNDFPYRTIRPDPATIGDKEFSNEPPRETNIASVEFVDVPKQAVTSLPSNTPIEEIQNPIHLNTAPTAPITRDIIMNQQKTEIIQPSSQPQVAASTPTAQSIQPQSTIPQPISNPMPQVAAMPQPTSTPTPQVVATPVQTPVSVPVSVPQPTTAPAPPMAPIQIPQSIKTPVSSSTPTFPSTPLQVPTTVTAAQQPPIPVVTTTPIQTMTTTAQPQTNLQQANPAQITNQAPQIQQNISTDSINPTVNEQPVVQSKTEYSETSQEISTPTPPTNQQETESQIEDTKNEIEKQKLQGDIDEVREKKPPRVMSVSPDHPFTPTDPILP